MSSRTGETMPLAGTDAAPVAAPRLSPLVFEVLADQVARLGTRVVFGVMGDDTANLTAAIAQRGVRYLPARHETTAIAMADGFAWAGEDLGICLVTRGPGLLNSLSALRTAERAGRRLLVISGDAPAGADPELDRKWVDAEALADCVGVAFCSPASAEMVFPAFRGAVASARAGLPALLAIPSNVLNGPAAGSVPAPSAAGDDVAVASPSDEEIAHVADALRTRRRPLILAGRGARSPATIAGLEELATRTGALLGTTMLARDVFRDHSRDIGMVGWYSNPSVVEILADVDCIVAFGASLAPETTSQGALFTRAEVIHVERDASRIGRFAAVDRAVVGDAGEVVRRLLAEPALAVGNGAEDEEADALAATATTRYVGPDESVPGALDPRVAATVLDELLPPDRTLVLDSGRFVRSGARHMRVRDPDAFRLTIDAGSIAIGLGVALGAALARPERPIVLLVGDGGLSMGLGDLETVLRTGVPITIVVFNDQSYGSERIFLEADGMPPDYADLDDIDFAAVAAALGLESATVADEAQLRALAPRLIDRTAPLLVDCKIRRDINVDYARLD